MKYCDENCNKCPILLTDNNRMLTRILNEAYAKFGYDFYHIVQKNCPNMTCCHDCEIDDFCHIEGCNIGLIDAYRMDITIVSERAKAHTNIAPRIYVHQGINM